MNFDQLFLKFKKPLIQGITIASLFVFIKLFLELAGGFGFKQLESIDCWLYGTALILFYIIVNCLLSFQSSDKLNYYRESIFTYAGTLLFIIILAYFFSGKTIFQAETYSWILFVFSIVYIVFFTIINLIRKIVEIAIKQDKKLTNEK